MDKVFTLIVLGGSSSTDLAKNVANLLGVASGKLEIKRFPDGEKYLRVIDEVKDEHVIVIQSMPRTPDDCLFEYLLLVDTLKDLGAKRVTSFIPYFAYARQDERFKPGEALSFKTVSKLIQSVGTDEIFTIDMHQHRVLKSSEIFTIPYQNLSAMPLLAEYVRREGKVTNPLVIGPDVEAEHWAKLAAAWLHTEYDVFEKKRFAADKVEMRPRRLNAKDRDVLIVDDIISTGGTMIEAAKILFMQGAKRIEIACTHPILASDALNRIKAVGILNVIGTDTVPGPISYVSVAPLIADSVRKMNH